MKLGAEPKKVAALGALLVVAVILYFVNSTPGDRRHKQRSHL